MPVDNSYTWEGKRYALQDLPAAALAKLRKRGALSGDQEDSLKPKVNVDAVRAQLEANGVDAAAISNILAGLGVSMGAIEADSQEKGKGEKVAPASAGGQTRAPTTSASARAGGGTGEADAGQKPGGASVEGTLLPDDFPGIEHLRAANLTTIEGVRDYGDHTTIKGVGDKTARDIGAAIERHYGVNS